MDDLVEKVKEANRIEDVIEETGFRLQRKHGKYLRGVEHDSLVVNTRNQTYCWNSHDEINEDVIAWLMLRNKWDFKTALEWLFKRARMPEPKWSQEAQAAREIKRKKESVYGIAQQAMQRWLWADQDALEYARSRGWTDETIREAGLGFSGRGSAATLKDLQGDFSMHGIDPECPDAVAIIGYKGDITAWAKKWELDIENEQPNWVEWKSIPSFIYATRLIYPHFINGKVVYFSARNIFGAEIERDGTERKSHNLPKVLVGERQVYYNHCYTSRAEDCVIVEGQADAITLGQWDVAAVALIGTAWQDKEQLLGELRKRHGQLYLGLDADEAGEKAIRGRNNDWPMAKIIGPMGRLARWPESEGPEGQKGKDVNDWLRWGMASIGLTDYQGEIDDTPVELGDEGKDLIQKAANIVKERGEATISALQRGLRVGYPKASRIMEELARMGVVKVDPGKGYRLVVEEIQAAPTAAIDEEEGGAGGEETDKILRSAQNDIGEEVTSDLAELSEEDLRRLAESNQPEIASQSTLAMTEEGIATVKNTSSQKSLAMTEEKVANVKNTDSKNTLELMESEKREAHIKKLVERQAKKAWDWLNLSSTFAEEVAAWAGQIKGAEGDAAFKTAFELIAQMERVDRARYKQSLIAKLGIGIREFNDILKAAGQDLEESPLETVETLGGYYKGWLLEFVYDPTEEYGKLAYRDPDGKIGIAEYVDIEGMRYTPCRISGFIRDGGVLFPSGIGAQKETRELVAIVEMFINQHYLLESKNLSRIISYYVLLTWVYDCFNALPYLRAMGEPGAGKSELMRRVGYICYRMMAASGANSAASFFRATEKYKGTVFIDEADLHDGGDMSNDLIKFLNLGAMKGNPIWRLEEVMTESGKNYEVMTFGTFCPKLIAMRKEFKDDAVGTRALTIKLVPREPIELRAKGIRLYIDDEFREKARAIRNMLLRWRFAKFKPEIEVTEEHMDLEVSSRLNQVTMPLKALAEDDPELQTEIVKFLRAYNQEMVLTRSMTIAARVVEAMWKIWKVKSYRDKYLSQTTDGEGWWMMVGDVTKVANDIMDEMNALEGEEEDSEDTKKKRKRDSLTARGVGSLVRNELQLQMGKRRGKGFPVFWDELKLQALASRYGIDTEAWEKEVNETTNSTNKNINNAREVNGTKKDGFEKMKQEEIPF